MKGGPFGVATILPTWAPLRLRHVVARRKDTGHGDLPLLTVSLDRGVSLRDMEVRYVAPSLDLSAYQRVRVGDIVMNQLGKPHGAIGASEHEGIISPAYFVMDVLSGAVPRFLHYLLRSWLYLEEFRRRSKWMPPSQLDLSWEQFRDISTLLPPERTQRRIADFLDRETARIDALVDKKRRLIDLLEEKRTALITQGVTKGLDPTMPTKEADFGEEPQHWERTRLRFVASLQTGVTLGKRYSEDEQLVERPYLRVANVQAGHLDLAEVKNLLVPESDTDRYQLQVGDVLMTEGGDIDKLGRGAIWIGQIPACLHQNHVFAVRPTPRLLPEFLVAIMASDPGRYYFETTAYRTTNLASTNTQKVLNLPISLPPIQEQRAITDQLAQRTGLIDEAGRGLGQQMGQLAEYRQALITFAVTGELDLSEFNGNEHLEEVVS